MNKVYGQGASLGDAIRQHRQEIAGLTDMPYEQDILEKWQAGQAITPEEQQRLATALASVIKFGKGVYKSTQALAGGKPVLAPTVPVGTAAKAAGTISGLTKSSTKAIRSLTGRKAGIASAGGGVIQASPENALKKSEPDYAKLAEAFYRRLTNQSEQQTTEGRNKLPQPERKYATAE